MKKQKYVIKHKVHPHRRDKRTGVISPVKRSRYAEELFREGAGWHEQERNRERSKRLQLDD